MLQYIIGLIIFIQSCYLIWISNLIIINLSKDPTAADYFKVISPLILGVFYIWFGLVVLDWCDNV